MGKNLEKVSSFNDYYKKGEDGKRAPPKWQFDFQPGRWRTHKMSIYKHEYKYILNSHDVKKKIYQKNVAKLKREGGYYRLSIIKLRFMEEILHQLIW